MSGPYPKVIIDPKKLTAKEIFDILVVELDLKGKDTPDPEPGDADVA